MARKRENGTVKEKEQSVFFLPVRFGNVSVGDETTSVGVSISRANLSPAQAERAFCGKRVSIRLMRLEPGTAPGQATFDGMDGKELEAVFDVSGYSVTPKKIGLTLSTALSSVELADWAALAKQEGKLTVVHVEAIPDEEEQEDVI